MRIKSAVMALVLLGAVVSSAAAQSIPALTVLSARVAAARPDLVSRRAALDQERTALRAKVNSLNAQCAAVKEGSAAEAACQKDAAALGSALNDHIKQSQAFNTAAEAALDTPTALSPDPNAVRLSQAQLHAVDGRIANLQKAIALLGDANPEWARERDRLLEDTHETAIGLTWELGNLASLGLAEYAKMAAASRMDSARISVLVKAFKEPLTNLPAEEARLTQIMAATKDPALKKAIVDYTAALHRMGDAQHTNDVVEMAARTRDAFETLYAQHETMKLMPPDARNLADGLYVSSAFLGRVAIIFVAEGPGMVAAVAGSALSSVAVGGRELVNLWQERKELAALNQNASDRNRMKMELNGRLTDLQEERGRLVWAVEHGSPK